MIGGPIHQYQTWMETSAKEAHRSLWGARRLLRPFKCQVTQCLHGYAGTLVPLARGLCGTMFFSLCVALVGAAAPRGLHRGKRACTARTACALNMSMPVLALGLVASRRPVLKWHGRAVKHRGPSGLRGNLASPCHPVFVYLLVSVAHRSVCGRHGRG